MKQVNWSIKIRFLRIFFAYIITKYKFKNKSSYKKFLHNNILAKSDWFCFLYISKFILIFLNLTIFKLSLKIMFISKHYFALKIASVSVLSNINLFSKLRSCFVTLQLALLFVNDGTIFLKCLYERFFCFFCYSFLFGRF
jgi:hypothetical protein